MKSRRKSRKKQSRPKSQKKRQSRSTKKTSREPTSGDDYLWLVVNDSSSVKPSYQEQPTVSGEKTVRIGSRFELHLMAGKHNYCYLLQSISRPKRTYFGVTLNLSNRIRQHNGEITGGAKATRSGRPWKIIAYISGFINRIEALRFEWRVHHPGIRWSGLTGRMKAISKTITEQKWILGPEYGDRHLIFSWLDGRDQNMLGLTLSLQVRRRCLERHTLGGVPSG